MDLQAKSERKSKKAVSAKSVGTLLANDGTGKKRFEWDTELRHFGVRTLPSGERRWVVAKRPAGSNKVAIVTLGSCNAFPLKEARRLAQKVIVKLAEGIDPNVEKKAARNAERAAKAATSDTFLRVARSYIQQCDEARASTIAEYQRMLQGDLAEWHKRPVAGITDTDIENLIGRVKKRAPVMANRLLEFLSPVFRHAKQKKLIQQSPLDTIDPKLRTTERSRKRVLIDPYTADATELLTVWRCVDDLDKTHPLRALVKILMLTGVRVGVFARSHPRQTEALTWRMVKDLHKPKLARLEIPPELRKTGGRDGETHLVPLVPAAVKILDQLAKAGEDAPVFTVDGLRPMRFDDKTRDKLRELANKAAGRELEHWTPHDLRRSVATGLGCLGAPPAIIDEILDHAGEAKKGIRGTYDLSQRVELCRAWLVKWASHFERAGAKVGRK